jgi:hypothetical protein
LEGSGKAQSALKGIAVSKPLLFILRPFPLAFLRLLDEFKERLDFGFRRTFEDLFPLLRGQFFSQKLLDGEMSVPAIQGLETG